LRVCRVDYHSNSSYVSGVLVHKSSKASYLHTDAAAAGGAATRSNLKHSHVIAGGHTHTSGHVAMSSGGTGHGARPSAGALKTNNLMTHDPSAAAPANGPFNPPQKSPLRAATAVRGGGSGSNNNTPTNKGMGATVPLPGAAHPNAAATGNKYRVATHRPSYSVSSNAKAGATLHPIASTTNTTATSPSGTGVGTASHRAPLRAKSVADMEHDATHTPEQRLSGVELAAHGSAVPAPSPLAATTVTTTTSSASSAPNAPGATATLHPAAVPAPSPSPTATLGAAPAEPIRVRTPSSVALQPPHTQPIPTP
jgi:hypothetical protein